MLLFLVLAACKAPPEAPTELNELSRYLYREWGNDDPEVMQLGLVNLEAFLGDLDLDAGINDRSFTVLAPTPEDVADVGRPPGRSAEDMLGVSVARASVWPVSDHARLQAEPDQTPTEPTAKSYARDTDNADCFVPGGCEVMPTVNDVRRENLLMSVSFVLFKDFRWVTMADGDAMISRSWTDQVWEGDGGNTAIFQSHSLDVWLPRGDAAWRYQLVWSESDAGVSDEGLILGTLKGATDGIFKAGDRAIEDLYYSDE